MYCRTPNKFRQHSTFMTNEDENLHESFGYWLPTNGRHSTGTKKLLADKITGIRLVTPQSRLLCAYWISQHLAQLRHLSSRSTFPSLSFFLLIFVFVISFGKLLKAQRKPHARIAARHIRGLGGDWKNRERLIWQRKLFMGPTMTSFSLDAIYRSALLRTPVWTSSVGSQSSPTKPSFRPLIVWFQLI